MKVIVNWMMVVSVLLLTLAVGCAPAMNTSTDGSSESGSDASVCTSDAARTDPPFQPFGGSIVSPANGQPLVIVPASGASTLVVHSQHLWEAFNWFQMPRSTGGWAGDMSFAQSCTWGYIGKLVVQDHPECVFYVDSNTSWAHMDNMGEVHLNLSGASGAPLDGCPNTLFNPSDSHASLGLHTFTLHLWSSSVSTSCPGNGVGGVACQTFDEVTYPSFTTELFQMM